MIQAYIGLGSNLDNPIVQVQQAFTELAKLPQSRLINHSNLFKSTPVGPEGQADYINAAALLETSLSALELLDALQAIENAHERKRLIHWGARTLDLDLLLYGNKIIQNERLTVPHNHLKARCFVLGPLFEINSELVLPDDDSIASLWHQCDKTGLVELEP